MIPQPDTTAAIEFLQNAQPAGPWALAAISPNGGAPQVQTFSADTIGEMRDWIEQRNAKENLYFHVNRVARPLTKKATREDIAQMTFLHVDVDPRAGEEFQKERQRILDRLQNPPDGIPVPTYIIDSGGGYQGLWLLEDPVHIGGDIARAEDAKRYNKQLETVFGADHCHNIDRILRLPGTINVPGANKRAKGRVLALATVVSASDTAYSIDRFQKSPAGDSGGGGSVLKVGGAAIVPERVGHISDLPIADWAKLLIVHGGDPEDPAKYRSRSEPLFAVCCELVRAGLSDNLIAGIITDPDLRISDSVRDKGSAMLRYAVRQIERAQHAVATDLVRGENGWPLKTPTNLRLAISRLGVELSYNEFSNETLIAGLPGVGPRLDDDALARLHITLAEQPPSERVRYGWEEFVRIAEDAARRNSFHPVREYFERVAEAWDGVERLDTWLIRYGGAADTPLTRAVGAKQLIGAVRRIYEPGCKHDTMLVLEGPQGCGKSRTLRALAIRDEWYGEGLPLSATDPRLVLEALQGKLLIEASELSGLRAADVDALKALLSRQSDEARLAYARKTRRVERQSVFFGSTNQQKYLQDSTGARRFWPVRVERFDVDAVLADRDQLWGEAVFRYRAGEANWLEESLYEEAAAAQEERRERDPWEEELEARLGSRPGKIRSDHVWALVGTEIDRRDPKNQKRLGHAMQALGFENSRQRYSRGGKLEAGYVRGDRENAAIFEVRPSYGGWEVFRCTADGEEEVSA